MRVLPLRNLRPDQLKNTIVVRNSLGEVEGFVMLLSLDEAVPDEIARDPATAAVWSYLNDHAPLRHGEHSTFFRYWMARDTYQAISPIQSLIIVCVVLHYFTPSLAYSFFPCSEPDFWLPVFSYAGLTRIAEADFTIGGKRYGLYGHDWRTTPPMMWLSILAERELAVSPGGQAGATPRKTDMLVVLSRPDFEQAVKNALRRFTDLAGLSDSALMRSRMVAERSGSDALPQDRLSALRALIGEAISGLQSAPRGKKFYRALHPTFINPASTQERVAELLDVPFSSYRRHLASGIERVTQTLWQWELGR